MYIAETNLQTTWEIWDRSTYGNVDGKYSGMTNKKWDGSTYRNVDGEILETGTRDYLWLLC